MAYLAFYLFCVPDAYREHAGALICVPDAYREHAGALICVPDTCWEHIGAPIYVPDGCREHIGTLVYVPDGCREHIGTLVYVPDGCREHIGTLVYVPDDRREHIEARVRGCSPIVLLRHARFQPLDDGRRESGVLHRVQSTDGIAARRRYLVDFLFGVRLVELQQLGRALQRLCHQLLR